MRIEIVILISLAMLYGCFLAGLWVGKKGGTERAARIVATLPLTLDDHKYPSMEDRMLIAIVEAGCRGAFAEAIRAGREAHEAKCDLP